MTAVYEGLRVLELCQGVAGPLCGQAFADLGARVARFEEPGGDRVRQWGGPALGTVLHRHLHRGKHVIEIGEGAGRRGSDRGAGESPTADRALLAERLREQAAVTDVLIVQLDPIDRAALGTDLAALAAANPRLVLCEITDFGREGPLRDHAGSELAVQAMSGFTRYLGRQGEAPLRVGSAIASHATAVAAFQAIAAALLARERDGQGDRVHVSTLRALLSMKSALLAAQTDPDAWQGFHLGGPFARPDFGWKTADGYVTFDFRHDQRPEWAEFCRHIGLGHIVDDPAYADWRATIFTGNRRHDLGQVYQPYFLAYGSTDVSATINRFGGISVPVQSLEDVLRHAQVEAEDPFVEVHRRAGGTERQLGLPFTFERPIGRRTLQQEPEPASDASGAPALPRVAPATRQGRPAPLAGIRVLDASIGGVGPWAGGLLGMLGAEVIKLESPQGDFIRNIMPTQQGLSTTYIALNPNKRGIVMDLRNDADRRSVMDLVRGADVWIENFRAGTADKLGIGYRDLSAINPRLVYVSATGFGRSGPLARLGATDPHVQAFSGFASLNGASPDERELFRWYGHIDVSTAANITQAVLVALYERRQSGAGNRVHVSMLRSALALQWQQVGACLAANDAGSRVPGDSNGGRAARAMGSASALLVPDQAFAALDEPVALTAATDAQWRAICAVLDLPELAADPRFARNEGRLAHREELIPLLARRLATRPAWWWVQHLQRAGVPAERFLGFPDFQHHAHYLANGMVQRVACPTGGTVCVGGSPWEFASTATPVHPAPRPGQHTEAIRARLWQSDVMQGAADGP